MSLCIGINNSYFSSVNYIMYLAIINSSRTLSCDIKYLPHKSGPKIGVVTIFSYYYVGFYKQICSTALHRPIEQLQQGRTSSEVAVGAQEV